MNSDDDIFFFFLSFLECVFLFFGNCAVLTSAFVTSAASWRSDSVSLVTVLGMRSRRGGF